MKTKGPRFRNLVARGDAIYSGRGLDALTPFGVVLVGRRTSRMETNERLAEAQFLTDLLRRWRRGR
jgi:hypothetical protein